MVAGSELCIDEWPVMNSGKDLGEEEEEECWGCWKYGSWWWWVVHCSSIVQNGTVIR